MKLKEKQETDLFVGKRETDKHCRYMILDYYSK